MMRLANPEWLLLLPVLGLLVWRWRGLRQPLRVLCLLVLWLLLLDPQTRQRNQGLDLWVLADRSASATASVETHLREWETILEKSRGRDDRLFFIDYAAEATLRDPAAGVTLTGSREATRTGAAIHHALAQLAPHRNARLLLLSDGFSTDDPGATAERLVAQGVALDYRLASTGWQNDVRVESFTLPSRAQPGEAFLMEIRMNGPAGAKVPYVITRDGEELAKGEVTLETPFSLVRYTDRLLQPGGHLYQIELLPKEPDAFPGNNRARQYVEITGGPRLLLVTSFQDDPIATVLRAQGFELEVIHELGRLDPGRLQGARGVILNNVPALSLPTPFVDALDFYVRHQGGGLMMTGGKGSFGSGGYSGSAIDELLPVSTELRNDHRKIAVSMSIVLDRSGSMGASAGGGTKMELAANAAAGAVELLGPADSVSVFAVDTSPHTIVPLSTIGTQKGALAGRVRGITSGGGGIFIGVALKAAQDSLLQSPRGVRHIILFADASDSEEPGDYKTTIAQMRKEGMTISVVGLGTEKDSDAELLRDIARLGEGRIVFTEDASRLPSIFEQETVAIARSAFIEEPVALSHLVTWQEIAARPLEWLSKVDGYNLSYLRPNATAAAITGDEEAAPLVAYWQRGTGRVAAVSFPLAGPYSETVRAWPAYGDFVQTLARWLIGTGVDPGLNLRAEMKGSELNVELLYDQSWEKRITLHPPQLLIAGDKPGEVERPIWQRMEPGRFRAQLPMEPGQLVRGAVTAGAISLPFGPKLAGAGAEWAFNRARIAEITTLARISGGEDRLDLSTIWATPRPSDFAGWARWLLGLLLLLFLLETFLNRIGWKFHRKPQASEDTPIAASTQPKRRRWPKARAASPTTPLAPPSATEEPPPAATPPPPAPTPEATRRDRFRRAKRP